MFVENFLKIQFPKYIFNPLFETFCDCDLHHATSASHGISTKRKTDNGFHQLRTARCWQHSWLLVTCHVTLSRGSNAVTLCNKLWSPLTSSPAVPQHSAHSYITRTMWSYGLFTPRNSCRELENIIYHALEMWPKSWILVLILLLNTPKNTCCRTVTWHLKSHHNHNHFPVDEN